MASSSKFGWFLGLVFGALFGVLFAPRKGQELRSRIKTERKKGRLGLAPLQSDIKEVGREIADLARDIYDSDLVHGVVETGRKRLKELSDEFVGDVYDFHTSRIQPLEDEGRATYKKAKREWAGLRRRVKTSAKIGKRAVGDIKKVLKKRSNEK